MEREPYRSNPIESNQIETYGKIVNEIAKPLDGFYEDFIAVIIDFEHSF